MYVPTCLPQYIQEQSNCVPVGELFLCNFLTLSLPPVKINVLGCAGVKKKKYLDWILLEYKICSKYNLKVFKYLGNSYTLSLR